MNSSDNGTVIRIMVVDDHPSMRMGLIALIQGQNDMDVVAEASNGEEAVIVYEDTLPDVVLMDLQMPEMNGIEALMLIRKKFPEARIIILSTFDWDEDIHLAIQSGAKSYLLKDASIEEIAGVIRLVYSGESVLPDVVAKRLEECSQRKQLSEREREVLEYLIKGRSNKEIAAKLYISEETVKSHLKSLFLKLQVRDRTEAAITAVRHGIVHLE
ncbi:MAG: response regulator transcription factor [Opitutales bacterium]|nr:response regulator transcription factor [Opitutales bacterium]